MNIQNLRSMIKKHNSLRQVITAMQLSPKRKTYDLLRNLIIQHNIDTSHFSRRAFTIDISDLQFKEIIEQSMSIRHAKEKLRNIGAKYDTDFVKNNVKRLKICTKHFNGRESSADYESLYPIEDRLVKGKFRGGNQLKKRLWKLGLLDTKCDWCNITEWRNQPAPLELDHINGDPYDNTLSNLRILCPNCHAQTSTANGKNIKRKNGGPSRNRTDDTDF